MQIVYTEHSSIDKKKWDQAILSAGNGLLYACSWYLDCIAPKWDALIADDYNYVFPVTIKHKYKIPYLVQPFLAQQLGLFSQNSITETILQKFIHKLPSYSYEINLNYANSTDEGIPMTNLILDLKKPYEQLRQSFSKNTLRNIAKARSREYRLSELGFDEFIKHYQAIEHKDKKINQVLIFRVIKAGFDRDQIRCCGLKSPDGNYDAILAYGYFNKRISYLFPASTERGKNHSAMFMLVDELVKTYAMQGVCFDFEGSMIEGIARFYRGFGAIEQPYRILKQLRPSFLIGKI
jgi:hypothetical protein